MGEWLGCLLAVLGVDGSSFVKASQRCEGFESEMCTHLGPWIRIRIPNADSDPGV